VRQQEQQSGIAVLGGGPAGLTAGLILGLRGADGAVFEAEDSVGGLAKTVEVDGYRFDLGGHRFFTKLQPVADLWDAVLGDEFLVRPRLSRIFFDGRYFAYPLQARDVPSRLGFFESVLCVASYAAASLRRNGTPETFEEWVCSRFGRRLYDAFFRSYTEKIWGVPGTEIRSEWAAQRIKDFSLRRAVTAMLGLGRAGRPTTLIEEFSYPRLGPGQMWDAFSDLAQSHGVPVHLGHRCIGLTHRDGRIESIRVEADGNEFELDVEGVVSTLPLNDLVLGLQPQAPTAVRKAAGRLRYRDLCLVALMLDEPDPFPDNWIYLHDPSTRAGRVQNFGAWSKDMVPAGAGCLGVEYFCFEGDDIWEMSDEESVELATAELAKIGLIDPSRVTGGAKVRVRKAYPMYDSVYVEAVEEIRTYLAGFSNLQLCGRNGLHRYNNQDHSMWTAALATMNLLDGTEHDVWSVNTEEEYHEAGERVAVEFGIAASSEDFLPKVVRLPRAGSESRASTTLVESA
jgi:protoporphyrinogen oxidase